MELKRYVLLNTGRIYDMTNAYDVKCYDTVKNGSKETFGLKKTSDNILNLVKPCKLWDLNGDLYEYAIDDFVFIEKVYDDTDFSTKEVKAIYKRQTNGDYKRYEIGGKE